jgi:DNA topoisomerase VI subunit B
VLCYFTTPCNFWFSIGFKLIHPTECYKLHFFFKKKKKEKKKRKKKKVIQSSSPTTKKSTCASNFYMIQRKKIKEIYIKKLER